MRNLRFPACVLVCISLIAYSEKSAIGNSDGNTFDRVRYNGGTVANGVDPKDWGNHLSVSSDAIIFTFKDGRRSVINPNAVTSLSYGQEAHRRVGTMIALAILVAPVALFGLFHKTRLHFIGIQYKTQDGKNSGLLLQGDKDNYRAILVALQSVSGVPVSVSDKDREFIPVGVTADVARGSGSVHTAYDGTPAAASPAGAQTGAVNFVSNPDGADIYVDDQFVGNSPATLKLPVGKRIISAKKSGYDDWAREITISDSIVSLNANLVASTGRQVSRSASSETAKPIEVPARATVEQSGQTQPSDKGPGIGWIGLSTKRDAEGRLAVAEVVPRSPADISGIKIGDFIVQLNGAAVKSHDQFDVAIASFKPGSRIRVSYMRGAWQTEATMVVGRE